MHRHKALCLAYLFFLLFPVYLTASPGVEWNNQHLEAPQQFELRRTAATENFDSLSSTISKIDNGFSEFEKNNSDRTRFFTDYHAVYPLPVDCFIPVLLDLENEDEVFPNMKYTRDITPGRPAQKPRFQEVKIAFKALGIGKKYHYIVYRKPTWYPDGSFSTHWALVRSLDGSYAKLYGSWYVKEFRKNGKPYTYIRNFVETEMIEAPPFFRTLQKLFSENNIQVFFNSLYDAAEEVAREKEKS